MARLFRLPSPAMAVGLIALVAALGGTAVALPGKNKIDSNDIKKNAVNSADIKNGAVSSVDVRNDGLTDADIRESALGEVPNAARAQSAATADTAANATRADSAASADNATSAGNALAVGGHSVEKFDMAVDDNGATEELDFGGLILLGNCGVGSANLDIRNDTAGNVTFNSQGAHDPNTVATEAPFIRVVDQLTPTNTGDVTPDATTKGGGTLTLVGANGRTVTILFAYSDEGTQCRYWGHFISG